MAAHLENLTAGNGPRISPKAAFSVRNGNVTGAHSKQQSLICQSTPEVIRILQNQTTLTSQMKGKITMTTMNNVMNITKNSAHITMRATIVNGECFRFLMNLAPLAEEEIKPVLDCLVNGELDLDFNTPKICDYIEDIENCAAEVLMRYCFESGEYDHFYAIKLISDVAQAGLCCENCCVEVVSNLHQLYMEYLEDRESAEQRIAQSLYEFFQRTRPFVFDVV